MSLLNSISKFDVNWKVYFILKTLKKVDNETQTRKRIVIIRRELETSFIPKKDNNFTANGIELKSFFKEIIEIKGIIAPIEKDSKIPFRINIKIKK